MDLAVAAEFSHHDVQVLLGYGDGTFLAWDFIGNCCIEDLAQGDFDGDGILDLVSANHQSDCVALFTGDGSGAFGHAEEYEGPGDVEEIVIADFNEDGHLDLAAAQGEQVSLYLGDGEGRFNEPANILNGQCDGLVAGDWDSDGHLDLAIVRLYYLTILLGDGQGGFGEPRDYDLGSMYHYGIDADDFNEDGILDLVVSSHFIDSISLFLGDGTGNFPYREDYEVEGPLLISSGDFDEDGFADLAVATFTPLDIMIFSGDGQGGLSEPISHPLSGNWSWLIAEDLDLDGHLDLLLTGKWDPGDTEPFAVLLGKGDGTFEDLLEYSGGGAGLAVNDFNEDGLPDVVGVEWYMHHLYLSLGDGLGGFVNHADYITLVPLCAESADFNEDGHADVAVGSDLEYITIFLGDGLGGFVDFN